MSHCLNNFKPSHCTLCNQTLKRSLILIWEQLQTNNKRNHQYMFVHCMLKTKHFEMYPQTDWQHEKPLISKEPPTAWHNQHLHFIMEQILI